MGWQVLWTWMQPKASPQGPGVSGSRVIMMMALMPTITTNGIRTTWRVPRETCGGYYTSIASHNTLQGVFRKFTDNMYHRKLPLHFQNVSNRNKFIF